MTQAPIDLTNQWHSLDTLNVPKELTFWLSDDASLTAKLKAVCPDFSVQVIQEVAKPMSHMDANAFSQILCSANGDALASPSLNAQSVQVREVLLHGQGRPQVFAQSQYLLNDSKEVSELKALGSKALGELLFNNPNTTRSDIEVAEFSADSDVVDYAVSLGLARQALYARRSTFSLASLQVHVCEVFLPNSVVYA